VAKVKEGTVVTNIVSPPRESDESTSVHWPLEALPR
jgi:hypothetical protein